MACHTKGVKPVDLAGDEQPKKRGPYKKRMTQEQLEAKAERTRLRYNAYQRQYQAKRMNRKFGQYAIYRNGLWWGGHEFRFSEFCHVKAYRSYDTAKGYAKYKGKGYVIMELMETEQKTIANHKAKEIRNEHK
jgi:hypothetical protein